MVRIPPHGGSAVYLHLLFPDSRSAAVRYRTLGTDEALFMHFSPFMTHFRAAVYLFCCLSPAALLCGGCGAPSFLVTPVANTNTLRESVVQPGKGWSPGKVAIIEVEGML